MSAVRGRHPASVLGLACNDLEISHPESCPDARVPDVGVLLDGFAPGFVQDVDVVEHHLPWGLAALAGHDARKRRLA